VLKNAISKLKLEKMLPNVRALKVESVYDLNSQNLDDPLSPGYMIETRGTRLKVNLTQPNEGNYVINNVDSAETRIEFFHSNLPNMLS